MRATKYLDALMERKSLKNDRQLADYLKWGANTVSQYRHGHRVMNEEQCLQVARELGMENPLPIIAAAGMDRAEKTGQRSLWEVFMKAIPTTSSLGIALAAVTLFMTPDAKAAYKSAVCECQSTEIHIMRTCCAGSSPE